MAYDILSRAGRWLVHNYGTELFVVGGPYATQKEFGDGLVGFLATEDYEHEDTMHIMTFTAEGPELGEFSSRFMEAAKFLARPEDPGWSEFEDTKEKARRIVYGRIKAGG